MRRVNPFISVLCTLLMIMPAMAQQAPGAGPAVTSPTSPAGSVTFPEKTWHSKVTTPYQARDVAPVRLANSGRLEELMRAGQIYLSLRDAIALAIENNLDIEIARYGPELARSDVNRAKAGGITSIRTSSVTQGPSSAGGTSTSGSNLVQQTTVTAAAATGTSVPSLDPVFTSQINWGHFSAPQLNSFIVGSSSVVSETSGYNFGISQGFLTGTQASLGLNNRNQSTSSNRSDFNPATTSDFNLQITQPLLQGFGRAVNNRFIRVATNNLKVSDLVFKQQVIATVTSVINLYWDLVSFNEDVKVRQKALDLAVKLYGDNKKQVEIGTLAPIEIVRAEAEVAARQQDLTVSQTNVLQQETILKNVLSRTGVASPSISDARIIPLDRIQIPAVEAVEPVQDMIRKALDARPELATTQIQLDNSKITLKGTKNALLPSLNAFVFLRNNAQSGQVSDLPMIDTTGGLAFRDPKNYDPFFIGGYSNVLRQLFGRNFPDYQVGMQLNIPIRNRAAQADVVAAQLQLRQNELRQQQQNNSVRVEVQNALIGLQQARARHEAAVKNRVLQEQTLDAEQKKYALGASTIFLVIQSQRDVAQAQFNEVVAQSAYARARTEMERATGQTLSANNVVLTEAVQGSVSARPTPLPVAPTK